MPPDTSSYMIAGYSFFFVVSLLYLVSLVIRHRNLKREIELLEELKIERK